MIITREHLEWFAPALREQLQDVGPKEMVKLIGALFQLSPKESAKGALVLIFWTDEDDITLGQNFRKAIEAADGRKFEAGS